MNKPQPKPQEDWEKKLKQRKDYEKAKKVIREFGENYPKPKKEQIIISPYAELPWVTSPDMTSTRWNDGREIGQ